jgi:copper chaperone CopZ
VPTETRTVPVTGMTCHGCERALERAVSRVPGVQTVTASHTRQEATVTFDSQVATIDAVVGAITSAGYTPDPGF